MDVKEKPMFSNNPFRIHRADNKVLNESKFLIPEEIPANERTAFHGAAAGAAKDLSLIHI